MTLSEKAIVTDEGLEALLQALKSLGYRVVGPTLGDGAIVYDDIGELSDLPIGWTDEQEAGHYRLSRRGDRAFFGYAVGPQSWKKFLYPPLQSLWTAKQEGTALQVTAAPVAEERFAFIGVRACELHAMAIQDRVLMNGAYADPHYQARRRETFIVAVNCGTAGGTCFCVSMDSGPRVDAGFDLALTELDGAENSRFLVEVGSEAGRSLLERLPSRPADSAALAEADAVVARTAQSMGRAMPPVDVRELLLQNPEHPRWDEVAARCLGCANCTMVCPTCFCSSTEDGSDLTGTETSRQRRWDSCFTMDFSYIHGGSVRPSLQARYRQWMTHKLATWHDQFGTSGCVGCGRCITWCPVGIDITEEVRAIDDSQKAKIEGEKGD